MELETRDRVLMGAVLRDAQVALLHWGAARPRPHAMDACEWVKSRDRSWPYSFERVGEALELDAAALRRLLLNSTIGRFGIGAFARACLRIVRWWKAGGRREMLRRIDGARMAAPADRLPRSPRCIDIRPRRPRPVSRRPRVGAWRNRSVR